MNWSPKEKYIIQALSPLINKEGGPNLTKVWSELYKLVDDSQNTLRIRERILFGLSYLLKGAQGFHLYITDLGSCLKVSLIETGTHNCLMESASVLEVGEDGSIRACCNFLKIPEEMVQNIIKNSKRFQMNS